jgi:hypothetical protein
MKYLLPCQCGQQSAVDTSQAGQRIVCGCGNTLDVPTIRGLRQLPPAATESPRGRPRWTPWQGALFVSGLLIAVGGAAIAGTCWWQSRQIDVTPPDWRAMDRTIEQAFGQVENAQLLDLMREYEKRGLVPASAPPPHILNQQRVARLQWGTSIAGSLAALGVLGALAAVWLGGRQGPYPSS